MRNNKITVFLVDDDDMYLKTASHNLGQNKSFVLKTFTTGEAMLEAARSKMPDVVVLDYFLDSEKEDAMSGIKVLQEFKKLKGEAEVIMLSGQEDIEVAVNSVKYGAFDYVVKNKSAIIRVQNDIKRIQKAKKAADEHASYKAFTKFFIVFLILLVIFLLIWSYDHSLFGLLEDPQATNLQ